jgi:hypothetical protein
MPRYSPPKRNYATDILKAAMARSKATIGEESHAFSLGSLQALINEIAVYHPAARKTLDAYIAATPAVN